MKLMTPAERKEKIAQLEKAAIILKTVANPLRLGIIHLLEESPKLSVGDLCKFLKAEQSLISHHLLSMKKKGILECKREGRNIYYSLKLKDVTKIIDCLENCEVKF